jgi:hypothetical protein
LHALAVIVALEYCVPEPLLLALLAFLHRWVYQVEVREKNLAIGSTPGALVQVDQRRLLLFPALELGYKTGDELVASGVGEVAHLILVDVPSGPKQRVVVSVVDNLDAPLRVDPEVLDFNSFSI